MSFFNFSPGEMSSLTSDACLGCSEKSAQFIRDIERIIGRIRLYIDTTDKERLGREERSKNIKNIQKQVAALRKSLCTLVAPLTKEIDSQTGTEVLYAFNPVVFTPFDSFTSSLVLGTRDPDEIIDKQWMSADTSYFYDFCARLDDIEKRLSTAGKILEKAKKNGKEWISAFRCEVLEMFVDSHVKVYGCVPPESSPAKNAFHLFCQAIVVDKRTLDITDMGREIRNSVKRYKAARNATNAPRNLYKNLAKPAKKS